MDRATGDADARAGASWRRIILRVLGAFVGLVAALILLFNLALNLYLPRALNGQPDRFQAHFSLVWMLVPGRLHVRGLVLEGVGLNDSWVLEVDSGTASIDRSLLGDRIFRATDLEVDGGSFTYQQTSSPSPTFTRDPRGPWQVQLPGLRVWNLRALEFANHRFEGHASLEGDLVLGETVDAELALLMTDGLVTREGKAVASKASGEVAVTLVALPRKGPLSTDDLVHTDATIQLKLRADDLEGLGVYLAKLPWLGVRGTADVTCDLRIAKGVLLDGSHAEGTAADLGFDFRSYRVHGPATLSLSSIAKVTTARGVYGAFTLGDEHAPALVRGTGLAVEIGGPEFALSRPFSIGRVKVDLPTSELGDLRGFETLLPSGTGVEIRGGTGSIGGHFLARIPGEAEGSLSVAITDMVVGLDAKEFVTDFSAEVKVPTADVERGAYSLSGSTMGLTRFGFTDENTRTWWVQSEATRGKATVGAETYASAEITLSMANSRPVFLLISQGESGADWLPRLFEKAEVTGSLELALRKDALVIRRLDLSAGAAELKLHGVRRKGVSRGAAFARLGPVSVGFRFDGEHRGWHPLGARGWYAAQLLSEPH